MGKKNSCFHISMYIMYRVYIPSPTFLRGQGGGGGGGGYFWIDHGQNKIVRYFWKNW